MTVQKRNRILGVVIVAIMMLSCIPMISVADESDAAAAPNLYGMGHNNYGQIGDGTTTDVTTPTQIGSFTNVTRVAGSYITTFLIDDGKLYGMGRNSSGQIGDGTTTDVTTPTQIGSFTNVTQVSVGSSNTFFIDSGKLYGMGDNYSGQMGNGSSGLGSMVTTPTQIGSFTNVTQVGVGSGNTFFIDSGKLYGMGANSSGQIGTGDSSNVKTPTQIGSFTNVTQVGVGYNSVFFIDDGKLYGLGSNNCGQIGDGTTTDVTTPTQIGSFTNVTQVIAEAYVTYFIDDGKLYGMGNNYSGQMGNGSSGNNAKVITPTQIGSFTNVTQVEIGCRQNNQYATSVYFIDDGKLYGMGDNYSGQMGNGSSGNGAKVTTPTQIGSFTNVSAVSAGNDQYINNLLFIDNGVVYGLGSNQYGQLGTSSTDNVLTPTQIGTGLGVAQGILSTPYATMIVLKTNANISLTSNDTDWGTVSTNSITIPLGTSCTVSGQSITFDGETVNATIVGQTDAEYTYGFEGWYLNGSLLQSGTTFNDDATIEARFSQTLNTYNVTVSSSNDQYGTVTLVGNISNTPYGSVIHLSGDNDNILTLNGSVVTATAHDPTAFYTYSFDGYTNSGVLVQDGDIITGATSIIANFGSTAIYTVLINPNDPTYGSVTVEQMIGVPTGSEFTVDGNTIEIYNTESEARPSASSAQYSYSFVNFTIGNVPVTTGTTISENTTVIANFSRSVNTYAVSVASNDTSWGTVSSASFPNEDYGSEITVNGQTISIGDDSISATIVGHDDAQYTYGFEGWYIGEDKIESSATVTGTTSIIAKFTRTVNKYTITWNFYDDLSATSQVEYGTVPSYTAPERPGYAFSAWDPEPVAVTGPAEYTATWTEIPHITVTFNGNGGAPSASSGVYYIGQAFGELPTAKRTSHEFIGWFTESEGGDEITSETIVTSESPTVLYAHWEENEIYSNVMTIVDIIPLVVLVAIIFGIVGTMLYYRK